MRLPALVAAGLLAALSLLPNRAWAQAACPIVTPTSVSATSYTLTNNDECHALIFTSRVLSTLTLPNANTVAPGFQALVYSTGGGVTIVPNSASTINGQTANAVIGGGQSGLLYGDNVNYFLGLGTGFLTGPASGASFTNLSGSAVFPGVLLGNSPVVQIPNGVLQITNPASLIPSSGGDILKICGGASALLGAPKGQTPAWWYVLDFLGNPRKIPLCG